MGGGGGGQGATYQNRFFTKKGGIFLAAPCGRIFFVKREVFYHCGEIGRSDFLFYVFRGAAIFYFMCFVLLLPGVLGAFRKKLRIPGFRAFFGDPRAGLAGRGGAGRCFILCVSLFCFLGCWARSNM